MHKDKYSIDRPAVDVTVSSLLHFTSWKFEQLLICWRDPEGKTEMTALHPASPSSVASGISVILGILSVALNVLLLLRRYVPIRSTPAYLFVPVFLALALPASIVLLVPVDLASSAGARGIWLPQQVMLLIWKITYWLTFALTWVRDDVGANVDVPTRIILPLLGEYVDSGDHTPKARLRYALRSNVRYQMTVVACCGAGLVYFVLQPGVRIRSAESIKGLVMALAYCWGLVLAIYLMGHGLVAIPRRLFRGASVGVRITTLQSHAPKLHDQLNDALQEAESIQSQIWQIHRRKDSVSPRLRAWIEEMADSASHVEANPYVTVAFQPDVDVPSVITERYLSDLTRKSMRARHRKDRFMYEWRRLVAKAVRTQAILDSAPSKRLEFEQAFSNTSWRKYSIITPYARYILHWRIIPAIRLLCGTCCSVAAACIIWSELVKTFFPSLSIISRTVVHHRDNTDGQVGPGGQVIASAWLIYMCAAALVSINDAKVWGNRALVQRNTYGESACWYAAQMAKLTVPLAYNFLTFFPNLYTETSYYKILGRLINLSPLGENFDRFFPVFILFPVCATLFGLYSKVKNVFGFGEMLDDEGEASEFDAGASHEGRGLIEREVGGSLFLGRPGSERAPLHSERVLNRSQNVPHAVRNNPSNRGEPTLFVPPGPSTQPTITNDAATPGEVGNDDGDDLLSDIAHRVRNTFDSVERPQWMHRLGSGIQRPRWLDRDTTRDVSNEAQRDRDQEHRGPGRWFGASPQGRIRL
ncbi:MAG: hypothetical protein M1833_001479 [Piccolia ochrophora]|nr:MAG: hypothetical protein M1833_001479 [Piccolia ochrophora]